MPNLRPIPGSTPLAHPSGAIAHVAGVPDRESIVTIHMTDAIHAAQVRQHAQQAGLREVSWNPAAKFFRFAGNPAALELAFGVELRGFSNGHAVYHSHSGPVYVPEHLAGKVEAVIGLDSRPIARSHHRKGGPVTDHAGSGVRPLLPIEQCKAYGVPTGLKPAMAKPPAEFIIELGGDYIHSDTQAAAAAQHIPAANVQHKSTDGIAGPSGGGLNDDATGEVHLDVQDAQVANPYATGIAAELILAWAQNTSAGYIGAILDGATEPGVGSVTTSWGGPEETFQAQERQQADKGIALCQANGRSFNASAGDGGATDGTNGLTCDYPASSPSAMAICGTRLTVNGDGSYAGETVWSAQGATGGGVSAVEPRPVYQTSVAVPGNGRIVGDKACNADPASGVLIWMGGQPTPIGGTSAGSPWYASLDCLAEFVTGKPVGDGHPLLYAHGAEICNDVTQGNNGGYSAGPGFDVPSGWGSLKVDKWLALLQGGTVTPPVPPTPTGLTVAQFQANCLAGLAKTFAADRNHEQLLYRYANPYFEQLSAAIVKATPVS